MKLIISNVRQLQDSLRQTVSEAYDGDATRLPKSEGNTMTVTSVTERPSLQQFSNEANQFCRASSAGSTEGQERTIGEPQIGDK